MKYVLFIFHATKDYNPKEMPESEYKEAAAQYAALLATPKLKAGLACGFAKDAVTVRVRDGETVTSSGPYLDNAVAGYCEFEAETIDEAIKLAARIPAASRGGAVEVRPSQRYW
jgi:hypothetical protein